MAIAASPLESFIWGAGGARKTPEQVAREREIAQALMANGADFSPVDHWLQGAARAAQAGVGAFKDWRAGNAEEAGRSGFQSQWDNVFGGGQGDPVQTAAVNPVAAALVRTPQTASDAAGAMGDGFLASLIGTESGGNWAAQNNEVGSGGQAGHFGRLQFGKARLQDAMNAGVIPAGMSPEQFMADPAAQQAVEAWHFSDIDQQAANMGLNSYIGQNVGGAQITPEAIRAMAHLGGVGGAQKFLETGGQYNPSDAYGTSLLDYALKHGSAAGGGGTTQVAQALMGGGQVQPSMQQLMGLASDPWASETQQSIVNSLLGQQMQQQDPMYQMQLQQAQQGLTKGDLEIQALLNPQVEAPKPIEVGGVLVDPNTYQPLFDSRKPEGEMTDTQVNLSWRAEQAGLMPGSPEYAEFMRSGGQSSGMALSVGPDGTVQFSQGGAGGGKPLTEAQSKDSVFVTRATNALPTIDKYEGALLSLGENVAGNIPYGNFLQSEEYQVARDAGREFLATVLRKDTGAAVTPSEEQMYGDMLLPRPGDKPATIEMKRRRRSVAVEAIQAGMPPQAILNSVSALENAGVVDPSGNVSPDPVSTGAQPTGAFDYSAPTPPEGWGGDAALWQFMSPEDRALW